MIVLTFSEFLPLRDTRTVEVMREVKREESEQGMRIAARRWSARQGRDRRSDLPRVPTALFLTAARSLSRRGTTALRMLVCNACIDLTVVSKRETMSEMSSRESMSSSEEDALCEARHCQQLSERDGERNRTNTLELGYDFGRELRADRRRKWCPRCDLYDHRLESCSARVSHG